MTLNELIAEVYTITGRPDRIAETRSAVKAATLKMHQSDYYYKDMYENGIAFDSSEFYQQLEYRTLIPRWRAAKYLRKYDSVGMAAGRFLDLVPPEMVLDDYKLERSDIYYIAGAHLNIKSSSKEQYYLLGCYLNPDITDAGFSSWIADDHPFAIIYDAAASVFKAIGKDGENSLYRELVAEQLTLLKISNVIPNGW